MANVYKYSIRKLKSMSESTPLLNNYKQLQAALATKPKVGIITNFKDTLTLYKTSLQQKVILLQQFDPSAYKSLPNTLVEIKKVWADLRKDVTQTTQSLLHTSASASTAAAARDMGGLANAIVLIKFYTDEIKAFVQCLAIITEMIVLLLLIPALLIVKLLEFEAILVKLASAKLTAYFNELLKTTLTNLYSWKINLQQTITKRYYEGRLKEIEKELDTVNKDINILTSTLNNTTDIAVRANLQKQLIAKQDDYYVLIALQQEINEKIMGNIPEGVS